MTLMDDSNQLRQQRQFLDNVEQAITANNREIIHAVLPKLNRTTFVGMARSVAQSRVKYIAAAAGFLAGGEAISAPHAAQLEQLRKQFEESRTAFDAVKRAISRGYIDVAD